MSTTRVGTRYFCVWLALKRPGLAMSARYDHVRGGDADEAVARAVASAEREFGETGWLLDAIEETT